MKQKSIPWFVRAIRYKLFLISRTTIIFMFHVESLYLSFGKFGTFFYYLINKTWWQSLAFFTSRFRENGRVFITLNVVFELINFCSISCHHRMVQWLILLKGFVIFKPKKFSTQLHVSLAGAAFAANSCCRRSMAWCKSRFTSARF